MPIFNITANGGINAKDANATPSDILVDKTAYVGKAKVTGVMLEKAGTTVSGSFSSGFPGYITGTVNYDGHYSTTSKIQIPVANLSTENIKKGVNIGGVVGTYEPIISSAVIVGADFVVSAGYIGKASSGRFFVFSSRKNEFASYFSHNFKAFTKVMYSPVFGEHHMGTFAGGNFYVFAARNASTYSTYYVNVYDGYEWTWIAQATYGAKGAFAYGANIYWWAKEASSSSAGYGSGYYTVSGNSIVKVAGVLKTPSGHELYTLRGKYYNTWVIPLWAIAPSSTNANYTSIYVHETTTSFISSSKVFEINLGYENYSMELIDFLKIGNNYVILLSDRSSGYGHLYYSSDYGKTWVAASPSGLRNVTYKDESGQIIKDGSYLYIYNGTNAIYRTIDGSLWSLYKNIASGSYRTAVTVIDGIVYQAKEDTAYIHV